MLWNSSIFNGNLIEIQSYAIRICFTSRHICCSWTLVIVYGPCRGIERDNFVLWLHDLVIPFHENWLLVGDFNFMRFIDNRKKPRADMNDNFIFNEIISYLGLVELPLKGRSFTWSNMKRDPLLVQLDWFFTSYQWTLHFPNTMVHPLAKNTSDHVPCVITISTSIPKAHIFRFENHWIQQPGFFELVDRVWKIPVRANSAAGVVAAKFKNLRYDLKKWGKGLSHLKLLIPNCNCAILILDQLEEERTLSSPEFNFRNIVKVHVKNLLQKQSDYWRMRCTIR